MLSYKAEWQRVLALEPGCMGSNLRSVTYYVTLGKLISASIKQMIVLTVVRIKYNKPYKTLQ